MKSIQKTIYSALYPLLFAATIVGIATLLLLDPALAPHASAVSVDIDGVEQGVDRFEHSDVTPLNASIETADVDESSSIIGTNQTSKSSRASTGATRVSHDGSATWTRDILPAVSPRVGPDPVQPIKAVLMSTYRS